MRRIFCTLTALFTLLGSSQAQTGDLLEYQQEIGGSIGFTTYAGDAGGGLMAHPGIMASLLWRRNLNARMSFKTNLSLGSLKGNTKDTFIPVNATSKTAEGGTASQPVSFSRKVADVGAQFELNFLGYGLGAGYKGLKRWTPYLVGGLGLSIAFGGGGQTGAGLCIPLGAGFRYKVRPRLNIGLEWTARFTTCDNLDDPGLPPSLKDPYGIKSGFLKNKDTYTFTQVFLTYDIAPKYRKCNN